MNNGKQSIEEDKPSTSNENIIINTNNEKKITNKPELILIDARRRSEKSIMVDTSKIKPKLSKEVEKTLDSLAILNKIGQF